MDYSSFERMGVCAGPPGYNEKIEQKFVESVGARNISPVSANQLLYLIDKVWSF